MNLRMILHLLRANLYHILTSFILSFRLPFGHILWHFRHRVAPADNDPVTLYEGTVWHDRRHPVHNTFKVSARYALIDLDRTTDPLPDYLSAAEARQATKTNGPVLLLTIPSSVGYQRSPVNVYYCYQNKGSIDILNTCIMEVTNTPWCEKLFFTFNPESDLVAKALLISPFLGMEGNWRIKTKSPGKSLFVKMSHEHPQHGTILSTSLTLKRVSPSVHIDHSMFFWLMPQKAAFITYWQSIKLWWKNVPSSEHPAYTNKTYRIDALLREQKIQGCLQKESKRGAKWEVDGFDTTSNNSTTHPSVRVGDRLFIWKEAKFKLNFLKN